MAKRRNSKPTRTRKSSGTAKATFYEAVDKHGKHFTATGPDPNLKHFTGSEDGQGEGFWSDNISSLVVEGTMTLRVYMDTNYRSPPHCFPKDFPPGEYLNLWRYYNAYDLEISSFEFV